MEKFELIARDDAYSLTLEGDLTIEQAGRIKTALLEALDATDVLLLNFEKAGEVSLSTLQVICAAHKSAASRGKRIQLGGTPPASLRQALVEAGFERQSGCFKEGIATCLWSCEGAL